MTADETGWPTLARSVAAVRERVEKGTGAPAPGRRKLAVFLAEYDRLRGLWPTNGFGEDTNIQQLIKNHQAWTRRAQDEADELRAEVERLRALVPQATLNSELKVAPSVPAHTGGAETGGDEALIVTTASELAASIIVGVGGEDGPFVTQEQVDRTVDLVVRAGRRKGRAVPAGTEEPQLIARCDNVDEETGLACPGRVSFTWGHSDAPCGTCGARCGIAVAAWERVEPAAAGTGGATGETLDDLTAMIAAADLAWSRDLGDPPAEPAYIKALGQHVRRSMSRAGTLTAIETATPAITLASAIHTLRVLAEPNRVIGYYASDALDLVLTELERLQAIEQRACDAERWTAGAGEVERSVGQREGVRYALYGEVPSP